MKTAKMNGWQWFSAICFGALLISCNKEADTTSADLTTEDNVIAVAATETVSGTSNGSTDSVYIMHQCKAGERRALVTESSLPAAIGAYLLANYSGYTFSKALGVYDANGTATGYVVVVYYNDKPVALQFDASGVFVKVLEQREKGDLGGKGWHHGGRFQRRGDAQKSMVALTNLPAAVQSYLTANYAQDTLLKAFRNSDSGYVVVSKNNGLFATNFNASGVFENRIELPKKGAHPALTEVASLPATVTNYLNATYAGYVLDKAFALEQNGTTQGYLVLIDANNTRYGILFDASGAFVRVKTIR